MEFLELRKYKTTADMFRIYKQSVLNKAAHSIGCDPSDLDDTAIVDFWNDGVSTSKAACEIENALGDSYPWVGGVR